MDTTTHVSVISPFPRVEKEAYKNHSIIEALTKEPKIPHLNTDAVLMQKRNCIESLNAGHPILLWVHQHLWKILLPAAFCALVCVGMMQVGSISWGIPGAFFLGIVLVCNHAINVIFEWKRTPICEYTGEIPAAAREKALELSRRLSGVTFCIDHVGADPYLVALILDEKGKTLEEVYPHAWGNLPRQFRWVSLY